jgi:hypothetical protein
MLGVAEFRSASRVRTKFTSGLILIRQPAWGMGHGAQPSLKRGPPLFRVGFSVGRGPLGACVYLRSLVPSLT